MPPISSHFQATIRKASKIKDGMSWIKKPPSCCQIVRPGAKASVANILTKRIAKMQIIRGNQ
jgi:hypothetical protein